MVSELNTGSKRVDCSSKDSTQTFILKRISNENIESQSATVGPSGVSYQSAVGLPVFNADRKHYTPTFLLPTQLAALSQQDQQYSEAFQVKSLEETVRSSLIYQPRPSSTFCFVCKQSFVDYKKHIDHPVHKKFLASSACEDMIKDLIESEQKKRSQPTMGFCEPFGLPRKARKIENVTSASTLALQYFKESSTCVSLFQSHPLQAKK